MRRLKRWLRDRCDHCGHRFAWKGDGRYSHGNRDGRVLHGPCMAYLTWRTKADERLAMLGVTLDMAGMTDRDVKTAVELRAESEDQRVSDSNAAFRVFRDIKKAKGT